MSKPFLTVRRPSGKYFYLVSCVNRRGCKLGYGLTVAGALRCFFEENKPA